MFELNERKELTAIVLWVSRMFKVHWHWQYLDLCGIQNPDCAHYRRRCVFDRFYPLFINLKP